MKTLRIAMLGMVDGNGHPYSWSAIINGDYDEEAMRECPYPAIYDYLSAEPRRNLGIPGAEVTHIWTDDPENARRVARASRIPHVADRPEEVVDAVDAVIVSTDKGDEHVWRCRPFIEAGLPVFVDKPLTDNERDLRTFIQWHSEGRRFLSTSALRYAKEFEPHRNDIESLVGRPRFFCVTTGKSWERYGIHALEAVYPVVGPGFLSARNTGDEARNVVHLKHAAGIDVVVVATADMYGGFGSLLGAGTAGSTFARFEDTFYAFKTQLEAFFEFLRTGAPRVPFSETVELMKIVIAGIRSREEGGREVLLDEILAE